MMEVHTSSRIVVSPDNPLSESVICPRPMEDMSTMTETTSVSMSSIITSICETPPSVCKNPSLNEMESREGGVFSSGVMIVG